VFIILLLAIRGHADDFTLDIYRSSLQRSTDTNTCEVRVILVSDCIRDAQPAETTCDFFYRIGDQHWTSIGWVEVCGLEFEINWCLERCYRQKTAKMAKTDFDIQSFAIFVLVMCAFLMLLRCTQV